MVGAALLSAALLAAGGCPSGTPTQTLTVVNQGNVRPVPLAKVERAITAQSLQLRAAWGTPCVQFGQGGWLIYLQTGYTPLQDGGYTLRIGGEHFGTGVPGPDWQGQPYAIVDTGAQTYQHWSYAASHEVAEMLVDPEDNTYRTLPSGARILVEVCDPVENDKYQLDGVMVDDFTFPSAWPGSSGLYDEEGNLSAPIAGQTTGLDDDRAL